MKLQKGKFVYKNDICMRRIHEFYDKSLASLQVNYEEEYIDTTYGKTHILIVGNKNKKPIFTLHGGNGISPLNIRLFLPLLDKFYIIAPDVIGMPGKSEPYRRLNIKRDDFGVWMCEIMDFLKLPKAPFAVSSYSSAMMLSLAEVAPEKIEKAMLLVPSGIAHGAIFPIIHKMAIPFMKYYFRPLKEDLSHIVGVMVSECDDLWYEFFELMMSSYKMEMRAPKEYSKKSLEKFCSPVLVFASNEDIFFPADKVLTKAKELFTGPLQMHLIDGKHLPSEETMRFVCDKAIEFFET